MATLFSDPDMAQMGHGQDPEHLDLGLGWIYYGLVRAYKPEVIAVIGSYRGFVPIVMRRAQLDNGFGTLHFIDAGLVDTFWHDPTKAVEHFHRFRASGIQLHRMTTAEFASSATFQELKRVDMLFVDGMHTEDQAQLDHETFLPLMPEGALTLFHDSVRERESGIYGEDRVYTHTVVRYMQRLKQNPDFEVLNMPLADGLTVVRHLQGNI